MNLATALSCDNRIRKAKEATLQISVLAAFFHTRFFRQVL
jgi:hypothetical protein